MSEPPGHEITVERIEEPDSYFYRMACECGTWQYELRPVNLDALRAGTDAGLAHILDVVRRDRWTPA